MASPKDLRDKPLSSMSYDELSDYISRAESAGFSRSKSKDLGKAEDLRKVLKPEKYGSETVESAKKKLRNSTETSTQEKLGLITRSSSASRTGEGLAGFGGGDQSSIDLQSVYDQYINSDEIKSLESELEQRRRARDEAKGDINDNPFYAEATRVGKIAKLEERAGDDIRTLEATLADRRAEAQTRLNIELQQYNINDRQYQNNLNRLNTLLSSGAIKAASSSDIAELSVATGLSPDMIRSMQDTVGKADVNPHVVTSTDNSGNVTISIVDLNSGEMIANRSLGAVGKASTSSGGSGSFNTSEYVQRQISQNWGETPAYTPATQPISSLW